MATSSLKRFKPLETASSANPAPARDRDGWPRPMSLTRRRKTARATTDARLGPLISTNQPSGAMATGPSAPNPAVPQLRGLLCIITR